MNGADPAGHQTGILDVGVDPTYMCFVLGDSSHREQSAVVFGRVLTSWLYLVVIFPADYIGFSFFLVGTYQVQYQILPLRKMIFCLLQPNALEG